MGSPLPPRSPEAAPFSPWASTPHCPHPDDQPQMSGCSACDLTGPGYRLILKTAPWCGGGTPKGHHGKSHDWRRLQWRWPGRHSHPGTITQVHLCHLPTGQAGPHVSSHQSTVLKVSYRGSPVPPSPPSLAGSQHVLTPWSHCHIKGSR